jgi:16S rRNA (guanine527-N7)-methyltransferase
VNPTHGALPLPVAAGSAAAITPIPLARNWPGLARAAGQFGVALDTEALARFSQYRELLLERNTQHNLTAIRDPEGIERKLFLDALAMAPALDYIVRNSPRNAWDRIRLVDVGAGAGFPGLPLKIVHPELDLTLIDATAKKVTFVNDVIAALGLDNARAVHGRAEDLGRDRALREHYDIATARAVASLPVLLEYVLPLLKVGGTALLPKGLEIEEELRLGRRAAAQLGAEIVSAARLPVEGTRLIVAAKVSRTPTAYPRRTGIPGRSPLGEGT